MSLRGSVFRGLARSYSVPALLALLLAFPAQAAFTDNNDGTVSDGVTGLMWDKCSWGQSNNTDCSGGSATTHTWTQALGVAITANNASHKGYADWRLPNKNELESLVKIDASSPVIDATAFPNTASNWYWSSTNYARAPAYAWYVYFNDGDTYFGNKTNSYYVRLVRSGQSFDSFDSQADTTAPAYQNAALNAGNTVATLTFDEAPVNNLASIDPLLKANITFASDGTTFTALAAGDVVALAGSTITVTFASALTGSTNKLKIAANSLKDAAGNVLASDTTTTAIAANDITPPSYQSAALNAGNTVATLTFDEAPVNNLASIDPLLKANVTFAADGTAFSALAAGDAVALSGSTVTVTFASALSGNTNKLKIAANSLKDAAGNVLASDTTTTALEAVDTAPTAFSFTAATNAALSTVTESASITVTGINAAAAISIVGGQYAISTDNGATWGAYTAGAGTVNLNDQVKVKLTSSSSYSTAATATLTIGGVSAAFSVTTLAAPAPAPAPSYDPGPYVPPPPSEINAPSAANTTLTGTTPVNAAPGSTLVIPAGTSVSGVAITLAAPAAGVAVVPVNINIGGHSLTVTPVGADTVVTLKTVTINGVSTPVLAVNSGAVTVSAQPGQPLLVMANNGGVITAGSGGGSVSQSVNAGGIVTLSVTNGYVVLPANAFASVDNAFAFAIKDGKLYAGEIAQIDASGKVTQVRLGSMAGSAVGDPLKTPSAAGLTMNLSIPNLTGTVARLSATQGFGEVIAAALGATAKGQNAGGVLGLATSTGGGINALPVGEITVDTNRADGVTVSGNGRKEVVKSGIVVNLVPAVADIAQLAGQVTALDKAATVTANDYGVLEATVNGATYGVQPGWSVAKANGGSAGFGTDAQGNVVYQDSTGNLQTLYPVFIDLGQIIAAFEPTDAYASATGNADGTITAKYQGVTYTLTPDYTLIPVPAAHAKEAWWVNGGKVYVKNGDGKTAQGFGVK